MATTFPKLFQPGRIGKLEIDNRIAMAPMGTFLAHQGGLPSRRQMDYYAERAKGGAGLIITEASIVSSRVEGPNTGFLTSIDSDTVITPLADLADAVHDGGAKIVAQLTPGLGRQAFVAPGKVPVAPSPVPAFMDPGVTCCPLTLEEIRMLIEDFGQAARRVAMAGFDGLEVHGHTGYLVDQFLSPMWNQRTDEYGGDMDRRMKFALDIIQSARNAVGPDFPIIFRLSLLHGMPGGRTLDESLEIAKRLAAAGVDALDVDEGSYDAMDLIFPPVYLGNAPFGDVAAAAKKAVSIPILVAGNITPEEGESILANGKADFVISGRGLISDAEWPNKVRMQRREDVRPCIRCNQGCVGRVLATRTISCSVNTRVGMERYYQIVKTDTPKNVLIIGGGPAGLEAARVAAMRGHQVTLMEKDKALGGVLGISATPPFKQPIRDMIKYWETQLSKLGVDVRLDSEVTPAMLDQTNADAVVIATGGTPIIPSVPGVEGPNVIEVIDWHRGTKQVQGQTVIMAGGGLSGCDGAVELAMQGKQVTIVEMAGDIAVDLNLPSRVGLLKELAKHNVKILTNHKIKEFLPNGILAQGPDGNDVIVEGDTIIAAFGLHSDRSLFAPVQAKWNDVFVVGDCVKPARVYEAVRAGFNAGRLL